MDSHVLVAAQISSLFPSTSSITVVVNTRRADAPLPPTSDSEHAVFAEIFHHELTGDILWRVIHDGQVLELVSLSTDAPPIRFIFPAVLLPSPSIVWSHQGLHILAITSIGSLFRVVVPISDGTPLWQATSLGNIRPREYIIQRLKGGSDPALVHVQGLHCVVAGLQDGSVLRLETEDFGEDGENGEDNRLSICFDLSKVQ